MTRFLCWLIGSQPAAPAPVHVVHRPACTPGRRRRRRDRRPPAGTALPRTPRNRSAGH